MPKEFYYVWIRFFENIGYRQLKIIFEKLKIENIEELYNYKEVNKFSKRFINKEIKKKAEEMYIKMQDRKIKIIHIESSEYPEDLKKIYSPPLVVFCKGNYKLLSKKIIGIVGARECTLYGKKVALEFAKTLAEKEVVIISGLAKGIDSFAHKGAILKSKNSTIAVIGTGLDICYPRENIELEEQILNSGGCIISEYILGKGPSKYHFPMRNRIVAALSNKLIVVEAKEKSGALITVDMALENGKEVYTVPGNIDSSLSKGTNALIKQGCEPLDDILSLI